MLLIPAAFLGAYVSGPGHPDFNLAGVGGWLQWLTVGSASLGLLVAALVGGAAPAPAFEGDEASVFKWRDFVSGKRIGRDRRYGTLEQVQAAPTGLRLTIRWFNDKREEIYTTDPGEKISQAAKDLAQRRGMSERWRVGEEMPKEANRRLKNRILHAIRKMDLNAIEQWNVQEALFHLITFNAKDRFFRLKTPYPEQTLPARTPLRLAA
jgi:hypothetical protein